MTEINHTPETKNKDVASILSTCPNCESGSLIEHKFSWICECGFTLYKQQRGRKMSRDELHRLATTGVTDLLQDFISKEKGKKYSAKLKLERDDNDQMRVALFFPELKTVICPCCSGCLKEKSKLYECECGFKLWKTISNKTLTERQIQDLLEHGITTEIKGFTSRVGKEFSAKLRIDTEEKQVVFDF